MRTIRPDTILVPSLGRCEEREKPLTISAQDPISRIPEYKACAARVRKASAPPEHARALEPQQ